MKLIDGGKSGMESGVLYEKKFLPGRLIKSRMTVLKYIFFFWLSPEVESICTSLVQHDVACHFT